MDINEAKAVLNAAGYVVKKPMSCREAGRRGGLKGGLSKSPRKLAGLAKARAVRAQRRAARKNAPPAMTSPEPPLLGAMRE